MAEPDNAFLDDDPFNALIDGDMLLTVRGGPSACLKPVRLRSRAAKYESLSSGSGGETTASPQELMDYNGLTAERMTAQVQALRQGSTG